MAPALRLDPIDLRHTKNERKLAWVLMEVREFVRASPRNTLVVVHKALLDPNSRSGRRFRELAQRFLGDEVALSDQTMEPLTRMRGHRLAHWGALNGSNRYAGWNVVALTSWRLPKTYAAYELAARLTDQTERKAVLERRERAELMQALHRSRQHRTLQGRAGLNCWSPSIHMSCARRSARQKPPRPVNTGRSLGWASSAT
ncbi:hypothetical protein ACFSC4_28240 [Deinococcus malanensis]|uniref:hypothetical protein n=1 Tax=Deinococcus malanensis TaxID=1706855 RepID=UPI0036347A32